MALKEIRLEHEEGAPCTAIREGKKTHSTLYNHCLGNARPSARSGNYVGFGGRSSHRQLSQQIRSGYAALKNNPLGNMTEADTIRAKMAKTNLATATVSGCKLVTLIS